MHTHPSACTHACTHAWTHACTHTHAHTCMHTHACTCVHTHTHTHAHTCMQTYACTHAFSLEIEQIFNYDIDIIANEFLSSIEIKTKVIFVLIY